LLTEGRLKEGTTPKRCRVASYEVYTALAATRADIRLIGCFAHARRKLDEALEGQGKKGKIGKAQMGLAFIQHLYVVEKSLKDVQPEVQPSTPTGKALAYLQNQWPTLIRYLDDGRPAIDNNACGRVIPPFVIGRLNRLFADTPNGAGASARLYGIIETAKANGHEPDHSLRYVPTELPKASSFENAGSKELHYGGKREIKSMNISPAKTRQMFSLSILAS